MKTEDAKRVAEIQVNAWKTAYSGIIPQPILDAYNVEDRTAKWLKILEKSPERDNLVVVDEVITGWAGFGKCRDQDKTGNVQELYGIYIDPADFRKGYGRLLWKRVYSEMLRHKPTEITLWVLEENHRARAFYEANGFRADGERITPEWLKGTPEIRMVKAIE